MRNGTSLRLSAALAALAAVTGSGCGANRATSGRANAGAPPSPPPVAAVRPPTAVGAAGSLALGGEIRDPAVEQPRAQAGASSAAAGAMSPVEWMERLYDQGNFLEAIAAANRVIKTGGARAARAYYIRGAAEGQIQEFGLAVQDLREATRRDPSNHQSWFARAWYEYENGDIQQAIASGEESVKLNRHQSMAWFNLGLCYAVRKDLTQSERAYDIALEHEKLGSAAEAIQDIHGALERYPGSAAALKQALKWLEES